MNLKQKIEKYIGLKQEGESWDYKREWHNDNIRLLHDIICMANSVSDDDSYIIIGVDEENDCKICDVKSDSNRKSTQNLVDFLRNINFAADVRPEVRVDTLTIEDKTVDVIVISSTDKVPFYLTQDYPFSKQQGSGKIKCLHAFHIYTRVRDTNTPINSSADPDRVEKLWKKRFGIDKTALQRFQIYLRDYDGWDSVDGGESWFYKKFPEFKIEIKRNKYKTGCEYYCLSQGEAHPGWYDIHLRCSNTIVEKNVAVYFDKSELFAAVPEIFMIATTNNVIYCYTKGEMQYDLYRFFIHNSSNYIEFFEKKWLDCIPVFENEQEKNEFKKYIKNAQMNKLGIDKYKDTEQTYISGEMKEFESSYLDAISTVSLLSEYRNRMGRIS